MKTLTISTLLCLICLAFMAFTFQPHHVAEHVSEINNAETVRLKAFKLKPAALAKFKKQKERYQSIRVSKNGMVTPAAGFKMIADKNLKEITVLPEKATYQSGVVTGVEAIDFGIFVVWCHCGGGLGDNCQFDFRIENGYRVTSCEGTCGCGVAVTIGRTPPWGQIVDDIYPY